MLISRPRSQVRTQLRGKAGVNRVAKLVCYCFLRNLTAVGAVILYKNSLKSSPGAIGGVSGGRLGSRVAIM